MHTDMAGRDLGSRNVIYIIHKDVVDKDIGLRNFNHSIHRDLAGRDLKSQILYRTWLSSPSCQRFCTERGSHDHHVTDSVPYVALITAGQIKFPDFLSVPLSHALSDYYCRHTDVQEIVDARDNLL